MKSGYVSIIGRPNSGKSTLLNKILGEELSIVTPKAQTTRHKVVGIHNLPGAQIVFLDTPGFHESEKAINKYMMEVVEHAIKDADVICVVIDVIKDHEKGTSFVELLKNVDKSKVILAINKLDTILDRPWETIIADYQARYEGYQVVGISAKSGHGVNELIDLMADPLPEGEPFYPDNIYTEHPVRFLVAETIREQIIYQMHQEIPHSIAVEIEDYKEEDHIHRIHAAIVVDKDSQKGMIIGKGGHQIKKIGEAARAKIEALVGIKVFLKLFVKVEKNWTKDPQAIKRLYSG